MKSLFSGKTHIRPLAARRHDLFQVLVPSFVLTRETRQLGTAEEKGLLLQLAIAESHLSLGDRAGKREFFEAMRSSRGRGWRKLASDLRLFNGNDRVRSYEFDCSAGPLRYANGGVLPVVRLNSKDYFCFFYRGVFPVGWNIANGSSDSLEEMLHPESIVLREFGEELFAFDHEKRFLYLYDPGLGNRPIGYQEEALAAWQRQFREYDLSKYTRMSLPIKWIAGPDRIQIVWQNRTYLADRLFVNITPEDGAIEVDRIALINLKDRPTLLDGEMGNNGLLNRLVGIFPVSEVKRQMRHRDFRPELAFFNGMEELNFEVAVKKSLEAGRDRRSRGERREYAVAAHPFDLCPITRSMVGRYFDWVEASRAGAPESGLSTPGVGHYDIFLSFRSPDTDIADQVYQCLTEQGFKVFCSMKSLPQLGESNGVGWQVESCGF